MALRVTIAENSFDKDHRWHIVEFDVDLISLNEMEFVDEDLDSMLAFKGFGDTEYDNHLDFYETYTARSGGFWGLVFSNPRLIYDALEEQGYDSFSDGGFDREQFILFLAENISDIHWSWARKNEALQIINEMVDFSGQDTGQFSVDQYRELLLMALENGLGHVGDIIETLHPVYYTVNEEGVLVDDDGDEIAYDDRYVRALILALKHTNSYSYDVETILDELMLYIDKDDVDYYTRETTNEYGDEYHDELRRRSEKHEHTIEILGEEVFKWERKFETEIMNPIDFSYPVVTDWEEHAAGFEAPDEATELLNYFDIDEEEHGEPEPPAHPKPKKDGKFAVLYTKYDYDWQSGERGDEIEEQILMPYEDKSDADSAIELSSEIFEDMDSEEEAWTMTLMERKSEEEMREHEFMKRQLSLGPEYEEETDPIFDEWRVYDEDE